MSKKTSENSSVHNFVVNRRASIGRRINILCSTWNVGNAAPPLDISAWIPMTNGGFDIIAVGAQECLYGVEEDCHEHWINSLNAHINKNTQEQEYVEIAYFCITPQANEKIKAEDKPGLKSLLATSKIIQEHQVASREASNESLGEDDKKEEIVKKEENSESETIPADKQKNALKHGPSRSLAKFVQANLLHQPPGHDPLVNVIELRIAEKKHIAVLGEIRLAVFIKKSLSHEVRNVQFSQQTTGRLEGYSGNKGGLVVTFYVGETRLCFLNAHLNAHAEFMERRNEDLKAIIAGVHSSVAQFEAINSHYCFFMGDLNYRVELAHEDVLETVKKKDWEKLLAADQLKDQQAKGKALSNFKEPEIQFPPTFKVKKVVEPVYSTERVPSYCDRVLWKAYPHLHIRPLKYQSNPEIITSDHKPVHGVFEIEYISKNDISVGEVVKEIVLTNLSAQNLNLDYLPNPQLRVLATLAHGSVIESATSKSSSRPFWHDSIKINAKGLWVTALPYTFVLVAINCTVGDSLIRLGETAVPLSTAHKIPSEFKLALFQYGLPQGTICGKVQFVI